jgi:hypothetical protein
MLFKIICFCIEIINWIALYFPRSLSSNQTTDSSPQVFEGLSTFSLLSEFHFVMFATISEKKLCSARPYLQLFVERRMFYLRYLCFFAHSGVQQILCCVGFVLLFCLSSFCVP